MTEKLLTGTLSLNTTNQSLISSGAVARSDSRPPGMRTITGSILTSGNILSWSLVMKQLLRPFSPFRCFKKGSCQLLAKECALSTGKLPKRLAQNNVERLTNRARIDLKCVEGS